jgi:adenylate cyclase class 2
MREIEIKARLTDKPHTINLLLQRGLTLSTPFTQHDVIFSRPKAKIGDEVARLRIRTEKSNTTEIHLFTVKKPVHGQLDNLEYETGIANPTEMTNALLTMGYELFSKVTKTRQGLRDGDYKICIDTVEGLGDFIEIEKLTDETVRHTDIVNELRNYLSHLGISKEDEITDGYDVLERKQRGLNE